MIGKQYGLTGKSHIRTGKLPKYPKIKLGSGNLKHTTLYFSLKLAHPYRF